MKLRINPYDKTSIDAAIKQLKMYSKDFRDKEEEFVRRLKGIGVSVAEAGFSTAEYDGINDVAVTETQAGNRAAVIAYGETVGFIEFGTGDKFREWDGSDTKYTPPAHGTYGKGQGKNAHGWYFKQNEGAAARHTYGNPPAEAMLTARDRMIESVVQIAREVWK